MCRCGYQTDNLLVSSSVSGFQYTAEISPPISTYSRKKIASQAHKSAQETQDPFCYVETKSYKHYYYRIKTITEGS
jgi:hypothetical protein